MNPRISIVFGGILLAAAGIFATAPQSNKKADSLEAARQNNLGAAYMNQQLFEKGLKCFEQAAELDPKLTIARLNEGIAYLNLQKIDEAKSALEDALKQDLKTPQAWYNLGLLAKNTGDAQTAIEDFKHVTEIDPSDADTWYFLGASYAQAREFPQAIDAFQHALKINPLHASAEFGLSRAYQQSDQVDQARENLKKFQYITQKKLGSPISLAYGEQGQYSRAVESPQAVLKPPPQIKVQFVDVTREAGLKEEAPKYFGSPGSLYLTPGACFLDYDNDGRIDLFLANPATLYHNLGSGRFEDVTAKSGLDQVKLATGCTAGDYDNDGFEGLAIGFGDHVKLYRNRNGAFEDMSLSAGLPSVVLGAFYGLTFIDYDHDGDLDLYEGGTGYVCSSCPAVTELTPDERMSLPEDAVLGRLPGGTMWRNNGNGSFTAVTAQTGLAGDSAVLNSVGSDINNDRAVDLVTAQAFHEPIIYENQREGAFKRLAPGTVQKSGGAHGIAMLDFDHDGWMDVAFTQSRNPGIELWHNNKGKSFERVTLPETSWVRAFGVAAIDYDNDGWVDLVAVGETKEGKGEIKLFRNLGPDGFKDVTADVGLDKIHLEHPRAIITGDYDNDGATDLLITQNLGPAVLLRNEGGNQNHWLRLALKGVADNKSAIGTKVEIFAGGNRQKFEIYGSNGYLGQNSPYLTVGLGDAKQADVVRMLWPTGVLQDEINVAGDKQQNFTEIDRRGSSCPTLFVWNGERYEFVADMLGAGVVGHWIGPGQRDIPRPVEYIKIDRDMIRERENPHASQNKRDMGHPQSNKTLSFRFMEPLEEAVYLDQVRLLAVDHPKNQEVYPNEYFASNPPYPQFKVVVSRDARPPAGAWDDHGHDVLPDLLAHRYFGDFSLTQFQGFVQPHSLTLDLGENYHGGPLWLLMHGEVEYFSANSMYAASQAGVQAIPPYLEALGADGKWTRVISDMGFPAGGTRTMTADLTGKLPIGTRKVRITTNLQVYWDSILIDRTQQPAAPEILRLAGESARLRNDVSENDRTYRAEGIQLTSVPLVRADLDFHGYPLKIEGTPPGNVQYIYEEASATGPYTRPAGAYTRYGNVLPLLTALDDKLAVFGSGDEVQLDFDPGGLPALPAGWVRDYFFAAFGYEKDMDFYAAQGNFVAPLPFLSMKDYPYAPKQSFPLDDAHVNYLLEYNTRFMSGNEQRGYSFDYREK
ncbi:MAG: FG-GAP-like repeat-containing protein [Candidatus Sulfotelmatobacter sp.]